MSGKTLFATDFPLYTITASFDGHVVVTGGGGSAKTGVPNALELYEVKRVGNDVVAQAIHRHSFTTELVMNAARHPTQERHMAIGVDNNCHMICLHKEKTDEDNKEKSDVVQRKKDKDGDKKQQSVEEVKKEAYKYKVEMMHTEQTDFSETDPLQKVVCFSHDGAHVITGGVDGCVRCWKFPEIKMVHKLTGHEKEVNDLTSHPDKQLVVSASHDCLMKVWDTGKGQLEKSCEWQPDKKIMWRVRACRFAKTEEGNVYLFTVSVPVSIPKKEQRNSYVCRWSVSDWEVDITLKYKGDILTALAVSNCGQYVAVGSANGDVAMYNKDLKQLTESKGLHSVFITGLCFMKFPSPTSNDEDMTVLSISADQSCCVTMAPPLLDLIWFFLFLILLGCVFVAIIMLLW